MTFVVILILAVYFAIIAFPCRNYPFYFGQVIGGGLFFLNLVAASLAIMLPVYFYIEHLPAPPLLWVALPYGVLIAVNIYCFFYIMKHPKEMKQRVEDAKEANLRRIVSDCTHCTHISGLPFFRDGQKITVKVLKEAIEFCTDGRKDVIKIEQFIGAQGFTKSEEGTIRVPHPVRSLAALISGDPLLTLAACIPDDRVIEENISYTIFYYKAKDGTTKNFILCGASTLGDYVNMLTGNEPLKKKTKKETVTYL